MRSLPAVHRFLSDAAIASFEAVVGRSNVKQAVAEALDRARSYDGAGSDFSALRAAVIASLERIAARGLLPVINATGVLLHTNLGRAPIAAEAFESARAIATGYSNVEFELDDAVRGSRYSRVSDLLRDLSGAQDAIVVNNCAAAVLLVLDTFAREREAIVSRAELIEIGGGFRLPDVFARARATLVEVGATNKVYLRDFEAALSPRSALIFRTHLSNFRMVGFTHQVAPGDLAALGARAGIPVVEDLGSGALVDLADFGLPHERTVSEAVADGLGLVAFSGDKLLGSTQAGIIVGKAPLIARLRSNPLIRALRVDKISLALLAATLRFYGSTESLKNIPFYRMLGTSVEHLRERAASYHAAVPACMGLECESFVGGGAMPEHPLPSYGICVADPAGKISAALRRNRPAIVGRTSIGKLILDLRTVAPAEDAAVIEALRLLA